MATKSQKKKDQDLTPERLKELVIETLDKHKAEDITTIDIRGKSSIGDYLVIASGRSTRQVSSLADTISETIKPMTSTPVRIEGKAGGDWVLVDAGDVIIHLFRPEVREFYNLEKIWTMGAEGKSTQPQTVPA